jgi:hypothetical protein
MKRTNTKGAKKVKTRVLRGGKLMVVDPEDVYEDDEVLGEEIEWVPWGPQHVDCYLEQDELEDGEVYEGELEAPHAELAEAPYGLGQGVAGYLEAGEAN